MKKRIAPRILILVVLAAAGVGTALAVGGPIIKVSHNAKLGAIVVDAKGRTLYHLTSEHGKIACTGVCTTYWPPVMWSGTGSPRSARASRPPRSARSSGRTESCR